MGDTPETVLAQIGRVYVRCCQCWRDAEMVRADRSQFSQTRYGFMTRPLLRAPDGWYEFYAKEHAQLLRVCPECAIPEPRLEPIDRRHFMRGKTAL